MIMLDEFVHLYHLKESKEYEYYELVPWVSKARIVTDLPSSFGIGSQGSFLYLGMDGRICLMIFGAKFLGCFVVGRP